MKKSIYLLITIFLIYGNGFASSVDFLNTSVAYSIEELFNNDLNTTYLNSENLIANKTYFEHDFCKNPLNDRLDSKFLMNKKNKEFICYSALLSFKEMESQGISMIYYTQSNNICETPNETNDKIVEVSSFTYLQAVDRNSKRLQNINSQEYFSQPSTPDFNYYRGFGIRFGL